MTLREESGTGPPAEPVTGALPPESAAPPEPAVPPGPAPPEPAAAPGTAGAHASPAGPGPAAGAPARPSDSSGAGPGRPPRRRRHRGGFLIGGLAAICLVGLGSFAAVLLLHGRAHAAPGSLPAVFRLRVGECINSGRGGISSPTVVPCAQPHDAEIYARFGLTGPGWPGTAGIGALARRGCTARLSGYLNPQLATAVLAESYVFPDQGAWNAGERTVICEIRGTAGKLTGSVRGLG